MAIRDFYNTNAYRRYPVVETENVGGYIYPTGAAYSLGDEIILDTGFVWEIDALFDPALHDVWLMAITREDDRLYFDFTSNCPGMEGRIIRFTRCIQSSLYDGMQAYWAFENNWLDSHDSHDGTDIGASFAAGKMGQAGSFDGIDDYVDCGDFMAYEWTQPFSAFGWVKIPTGEYGTILSRFTGSRGWWLYSAFPTGNLAVNLSSVNGANNRIVRLTNATAADGTWHHGGFTYDGSGVKSGINVFLDGVNVGTAGGIDNLSGTIVGTAGTPVRIGRTNADWSCIRAEIDELSAWNRVLLQDEIDFLYNSNVGRRYNELVEGVDLWGATDFEGARGPFVGSSSSSLESSSSSSSLVPCAPTRIGEYIEDICTGFLVTGNLWDLGRTITDGRSLCFPAPGLLVEPAQNQTLHMGYVQSLNLANLPRTSIQSEESSSSGPDEPVIMATNITGDVKFKPGYNSLIVVDEDANSITFGSQVGAGEGEPCEPTPIQPEGSSLSSSSYPAYWGETGQDMLGYWAFDNDWTDSHNGYDGTDIGPVFAPSSTGTGLYIGAQKVGINCAVFDGIDDYVDLGDVFNFERTQPFSVSFWIQTQTTTFGRGVISRHGLDAGKVRGWVVGVASTGRVMFWLTNDQIGGNHLLQSSFTLTVNDGSWHHVLVTYDGSSAAAGVNIYVDGVLDVHPFPIDSLSATIQLSQNARIGAWRYTTLLDGGLDELTLWERELDQDAALWLYNCDNGRGYDPSAAGLAPWCTSSSSSGRGEPNLDPLCDEVIATINGAGGRNIEIVGGAGIEVTPRPETHEIDIRFTRTEMFWCASWAPESSSSDSVAPEPVYWMVSDDFQRALLGRDWRVVEGEVTTCYAALCGPPLPEPESSSIPGPPPDFWMVSDNFAFAFGTNLGPNWSEVEGDVAEFAHAIGVQPVAEEVLSSSSEESSSSMSSAAESSSSSCDGLNALRFSGSEDVRLPVGRSLRNHYDNWTVSMWFNFEGGNRAMYSEYADNDDYFRIDVHAASKQIMLRGFEQGALSDWYIFPGSPIVIGQWHYLHLAFDGTDYHLWIDCAYQGSFTSNMNWPHHVTSPDMIQRSIGWDEQTGLGWTGKISATRINRTFIRGDEGNSSSSSSVTCEPQLGLWDCDREDDIGLYTFVEGTGTTLIDRSCYEQHGTFGVDANNPSWALNRGPCIDDVLLSCYCVSSSSSCNLEEGALSALQLSYESPFTAQGVALPTSHGLRAYTEWTVSGWFSTKNTFHGTNLIYAEIGGIFDRLYLYINQLGNFAVSEIWNGDFGGFLSNSAIWNNGQWHYFILTFDGTDYDLWIDGAYEGGIATQCGWPWPVGSFRWLGTGPQIRLSAIRLSNVVRSDTSVPDSIWPCDENDFGLYPYYQTSGNTLYDFSCYGLHGDLTASSRAPVWLPGRGPCIAHNSSSCICSSSSSSSAGP